MHWLGRENGSVLTYESILNLICFNNLYLEADGKI